MSLQAIETKREVIESRARIRELVFGIQDGLISTVGLLAGVQGATESATVVIITGLTAMFSGAISMAAGSYLSSNAQKEIFDKELHEAEILAEKEPYLAAEGLLKSLSHEGLSREQSYSIVKLLLRQQDVFLRTFQEKGLRSGLGGTEPATKGGLRHGPVALSAAR
jgi:VIT1/CCC1 family predicted Fe2+/Mn2+ transporter